LQPQLEIILCYQLADVMLGTVFLFVGLVACAFAALRRHGGMRLFVWLGTWSAMYGVRLLTESPAAVAVLPHWFQFIIPSLQTTIIYLLLPVALFAWLELSTGAARVFLRAMIFTASAIGAAGIAFFVATNSTDKLLLCNHLLAAIALLFLFVTVTVPQLCKKFFVLPNRAVVMAGTLTFALAGLYFNFSRVFHYQVTSITGGLGLAVLLFSFGYVAVQIAVESERRLLSIEKELAIARDIQTSILPCSNPKLNNIGVAAAYRPMTAVAGDFYQFIIVDMNRVGILVADVMGHGIPAALIAAMIKVAMQSVVHCAHNPGDVLEGLNHTLSGQMSAQLVTAAYLWLDTENRIGLYSAAGHPPLLHWRKGKQERIESNGVPLGVLSEPVFPVFHMRIEPGDRFLLYTDGVIESQNTRGDCFGDSRLEQVIHDNQSRPASELVDELLFEIRQ
jgi:phosphoserine phosphatase RsbU/P